MTDEELEVIRKQAEAHRGFRRGAEHAVDIYLDMLAVFNALDAANKRVEKLEAGGCARDQGTTQYCAEAVALQKRVDELERAIKTIALHAPSLDTIGIRGLCDEVMLPDAALKKEPGNDAG